MSGPAAAIATPPLSAASLSPSSSPEIRTFDQALEQRLQSRLSAGAIPQGLWQLGENALRISDRMHGDLPVISSAKPGNDAGAMAKEGDVASTGSDSITDSQSIFTRAKNLIDSSFGYAVLTQQIVRGANQAASGLTTLMRSS
jgi:hypothetical protein